MVQMEEGQKMNDLRCWQTPYMDFFSLSSNFITETNYCFCEINLRLANEKRIDFGGKIAVHEMSSLHTHVRGVVVYIIF